MKLIKEFHMNVKLANSITTSFLGLITIRITKVRENIDQGSWQNLWSIKTIFVGFILVVGLRVNYCKSTLYGIHVREYFMHATSQVLS